MWPLLWFWVNLNGSSWGLAAEAARYNPKWESRKVNRKDNEAQQLQ